MNFTKKKSFETLFKSYHRGMYNICFRMLANKQDAEDVLQDAFFQAYTKIDGLKSIESFGAWLKTIVVNRCIRFMQSRVQFVDIENVSFLNEQVDENNFSEFSMQQINTAISKLSDGCRIVFNLYLLENYKHKQISDMLNISESTSKSQYQRARALLQAQLKTMNSNG